MLINRIFKILGGCFYGCRMMCDEYVQREGMYLMYKSKFRCSLNRETRGFSSIRDTPVMSEYGFLRM